MAIAVHPTDRPALASLAMNTVIVSRRVQWTLLVFVILTLLLFAPLLLAIGIGLTVAITVHPFYTRMHRYFQISERTKTTENFFAVTITLVIAIGCLLLLSLPVWLVIDNRNDIGDGIKAIVERVESIDLSAFIPDIGGGGGEEVDGEVDAAGEGVPVDTEGEPTPADAGDAESEADTSAGTQPRQPATVPLDGEETAEPEEVAAGEGESALPVPVPQTAPHSSGITMPPPPVNGGPVPPPSPIAANGPPGATVSANGSGNGGSLITATDIQDYVSSTAQSILGALPFLALEFFFFASTLYLGLRFGAAVWRRALVAVETQTRDILQRISGVTYRTCYAVYVVHFTTVLMTFVFAIPLFLFGLSYENVLLWCLLCALMQLIPFLGPSLIFLGLIALEFVEGGPLMWHNVAWLFFYGYLFVAIVPDWVFRPMLMGRSTGMNPMVMWLGFFGGIALMGPAGFVFGPLILALLIEGFNIVLERYPDPLLTRSSQSATATGERRERASARPEDRTQKIFVPAGATAAEDDAIRQRQSGRQTSIGAGTRLHKPGAADETHDDHTNGRPPEGTKGPPATPEPDAPKS